MRKRSESRVLQEIAQNLRSPSPRKRPRAFGDPGRALDVYLKQQEKTISAVQKLASVHVSETDPIARYRKTQKLTASPAVKMKTAQMKTSGQSNLSRCPLSKTWAFKTASFSLRRSVSSFRMSWGAT